MSHSNESNHWWNGFSWIFRLHRDINYQMQKSEEKIGCKIRGICYRYMTMGVFDDAKENDQKVVKIESCEHRIQEEEILAWLGLYCEGTSNLEEDCFRDTTAMTGNNRSSNYSVMMKLDQNIPQLIPMCRPQIRIYHADIMKLCTQCFWNTRSNSVKAKKKFPGPTMSKISKA